MKNTPRIIVLIAMFLCTIVSMWTTYRSLYDSILPEPALPIPYGEGKVWHCSIFALMLSVAVGLMLVALKIAIIDEQKRLSPVGVIGLTIVAFISISFNMDVLYRWADQDFFLRYSTARMKSVYEDYLAEAQAALTQAREALLVDVAVQQGELESEIRGIREAPPGYGPLARQEDYQLTLMEKETEVVLQPIDEALKAGERADELLGSTFPGSIAEIEQLQAQLRVATKDVSAVSRVPLPEVVRMDSPLFAVFSKLFDVRTVGLKEIFILAVAFFIDLGDILGYSLVPAETKHRKRLRPATAAWFPGPERIPDSRFGEEDEPAPPSHLDELPSENPSQPTETSGPRRRAKRSVRFGRRF